jgi:hypothetical protein
MGDNNFRNQAQAQAKAGSEAAQAGVDALNAVNPMDPVNAGSAGVGVLAKLLAKFGLKKLSGLRKADEASSDPTLVFDEKKFEYIFGRVASNPHNKARSRQLALQMKALGVFDDEAGRYLKDAENANIECFDCASRLSRYNYISILRQ